MSNEKKVRALGKKLNNISAKFDHDFIELVESGVNLDLISATMEDELIYEIEKEVTRFELINPTIYILGLKRHDGDDGNPEVELDWVDMNDREDN